MLILHLMYKVSFRDWVAYTLVTLDDTFALLFPNLHFCFVNFLANKVTFVFGLIWQNLLLFAVLKMHFLLQV